MMRAIRDALYAWAFWLVAGGITLAVGYFLGVLTRAAFS
jgi:hypothetical protein